MTELGYKKHTPQFWQAVGGTLDVSLENLAMVGDSLEHDVLAPRALGVYSVWFNEGGRQPRPAVSVPTVTYLPDFTRLIELESGNLFAAPVGGW